MNNSKQKLAARIMAIFLSVLMAASGFGVIIALIIDMLAK